MKIYEWNIHMSATIPSNNGYCLKPWVIEEITKEGPDCFVLTEFVVSTGIDYYFQVMRERGYHWFISSSTKTNGILIGFKEEAFDFKDLFGDYSKPSILTNQILVEKYLYKYLDQNINQPLKKVIEDHQLLTDQTLVDKNIYQPLRNVIKNNELLSIDLPDFYEVRVRWKDTPLSFIGVRIKSQNKSDDEAFKTNQFRFLDNYLSGLANNNQKYICVGDMNAWWTKSGWQKEDNHTLKETAKQSVLLTPEYNNPEKEWWSYVLEDKKTGKPKPAQLDHMITNLLTCNNSDNKKIKSIEYDWKFINSLRYPVGIKADSLYKPVGCPDHAILKVELDI